MQHFSNDKTTLVSQAIDGLLALSGGRLLRFAHDASARVVLRADQDPNKVALVSGGGSGHEPAHAGFVGRGMLSAAVCGEVFASPSVDAVFAGIRAVAGPAGCLLIVKNYTGDRLNFGLAAEKAKALGIAVETVFVADDVAIPGSPQPRGVAGTLFVHKIAGHLAEQGKPLAEVAAAARSVSERLVSLGVARDTCTVPGNEKVSRVPAGQLEVGLGIHGEPGVEVASFADLSALIETLCERLDTALSGDSRRMALLLNNLGGVSVLEMSIIAAEIANTKLAARVERVIGPGALMTSLDMPGFSISCLPLEAGEADALDAAVDVPAWPAAVALAEPQFVAMPEQAAAAEPAPSDDPAARRVLEAACQACIAAESELNQLDAKVGDGDTGSTFAAIARSLLDASDQLPYADGAALLGSVGNRMAQTMGGSSGVLLSILFTVAGDSYAKSSNWAAALAEGLAAMQRYGGAERGDRTMIDALGPALDKLVSGSSLAEAAEAAEAGAQATATMKSARAGRSAYLNEQTLGGNADPGALAVSKVLAAVANT